MEMTKKKKTMKRLITAFAVFAILALTIAAPAFWAGTPYGTQSTAFAEEYTDEIVNYMITATVQEDGKVALAYHIDWKVLESDSAGPVSWVEIGIPNRNVDEDSLQPLAENISDIYFTDDCTVCVEFTKEFYAGETISFDFSFIQDYMYQMNGVQEGYTHYSFTPGWFDSIPVDNLTILWFSDKVSSWSPECLMNYGYNTWKTTLAPGETFTVTVDYPNDAFAFDETKYIDEGYYDTDYDYDDDDGFSLAALVGGGYLLFCLFSGIMGAALGLKNKAKYKDGAGFGQTKPKITRTRIKYFDSCPGCGAVRKDGQTECEYCGRSFIESEEILKEEELSEEDKEAMKYDKDGEYRYSSSPNTFVRVHVVPVPVVHHHSSSSSRSHSSCAHSSCACAHCACACACACAGGGRAGCSTKDFYKTELKLNQLTMKKHKSFEK